MVQCTPHAGTVVEALKTRKVGEKAGGTYCTRECILLKSPYLLSET